MIVKTKDSFYKVRMVYSLEVTKLTPGRWDWLKFWESKKDLTEPQRKGGYQLEMKYLGEDDQNHAASWSCKLKEPLSELHADIMLQLEKQDHEIMDKAFEEAVNNLGREKK